MSKKKTISSEDRKLVQHEANAFQKTLLLSHQIEKKRQNIKGGGNSVKRSIFYMTEQGKPMINILFIFFNLF